VGCLLAPSATHRPAASASADETTGTPLASRLAPPAAHPCAAYGSERHHEQSLALGALLLGLLGCTRPITGKTHVTAAELAEIARNARIETQESGSFGPECLVRTAPKRV